MNSNEYQVTIKSANQKVDDYVTNCRPSWTVHRLKQHISETHVNKPTIEDQRLIYAGNLLKDTHTLKQIFFRDSLCTELTSSNRTDFTIHLVCHTHTYKPASNNPANGGGHVSSSSSTRLSSYVAPNIAPSTSQPTGNHRTQPNTSNIITTTTATTTRPDQQAPVNASMPATLINGLASSSVGQAANTSDAIQQAEIVRNLMQSDQMRQQMAVFQQLACLVAAQIASNVSNNNFNRANASTDRIGQSPSFVLFPGGQSLNVQITTSPNNHIVTTASQMLYAGNRQQTQFVQPDGRDGRTGVGQNENLNNENNANAPVVGEPGPAQFGFGGQMQAPAPVVDQPAPQADQNVPMMQHDVIDWVYYSIRAAVLMAALYIHASMLRLLFIVGILAVAYFFNRRSAGRVLPNRQEPQPPLELHAPRPQQVAQEDADLRIRNLNQENLIVGDNGNRGMDGALREREQNETVPGRVPFLKLCYLVVTDFLASLVPE